MLGKIYLPVIVHSITLGRSIAHHIVGGSLLQFLMIEIGLSIKILGDIFASLSNFIVAHKRHSFA